MASITIPASGAVQVRINYTMSNVQDGTAYGKTNITITGLDASNATGLAVGSGLAAFDVAAIVTSTGVQTANFYSFSGTAGVAPAVPLGSGFSAFPGISAATISISRTARNEKFQFIIKKYAGYGGGGYNPCFLYGNPSKTLYLGNQVSSNPWGSAEIDLPDAATASTITASDGNIGSQMTITINRASSSFTHTLTYKFGSATGTIATKTNAASVSWTPPTSLYSQVPSATSGSCTITCETFSGNTSVGKTTKTITLSVPASVKPTVSSGWATVSRDNGSVSVAKWIQGYSKAKVTFDPSKVTAGSGSSIKSYSISYGGKTYAASSNVATTPVLTTAGEQSITATVTDQRGRTAASTLKVTVLAYAKPALSKPTAFRSDEYGAASDSGLSYTAKTGISYSSLDGGNTASIYVHHKVSGGSFGGASTMTANTAKTVSGLTLTNTYIVEIYATDTVGNRTSTSITIPTAAIAMNLRRDHNGVAFGKYSEHEKALELPEDWHILIGETQMSASDVGAVPTSRTVNGKALSSNIELTASDIKMVTLDANTDLNDVKTPGLYFITQSTAVTNAPASAVNGWLEVLSNPAGTAIKQIWHRQGSNPNTFKDEYVRLFQSSAWGEWFAVGYPLVLLWTNASPGSGFNAQTVSLSLTKYPMIAVVFLQNNNAIPTAASTTQAEMLVFLRKNASGISNYSEGDYTSRRFSFNDTGVKFLAGSLNGTGSAYVQIPYKIYGVGGVK